MDPVIVPSAYRHGFTDEHILHAYRNVIRVFDQDDDMTMLVGADQTGRLLEVGVIDSQSGPIIAHCMTARDKYLR